MRRRILLVGLAALAATAARAGEEQAARRWTYRAAASAGYRFVDVDGSEERYRTDVDLREGGRLFLLEYDGESELPDDTPIDRVFLQVDSPGEEPASYFTLHAQDKRRWDLRADFTRSRWVYDVPQLWEEPVAGDRSTADLHQWNFIRTQGRVDLTITPKDLPTFRAGYRLYERDGESTSTVFVPAGDTFVLDAPVDSVANVGLLGTDFRWLSTDWSLTQEYRVIERRFDATGPTLFPRGLDPSAGIALLDYERDRHDTIQMPVTIVRLRRPIGEDADLTGAYLYSHAALDADAARTSDVSGGTPPYTGVGRLLADADGSLDTHVADLGGSVRVAKGVTLHASYRFNERSQDVDLVQERTAGDVVTDGGYHVRWQSVTGDAQYEPRRTVSLRAGLRWAHRDVTFALADESEGTDYLGAIAGARWRPLTWLDLDVRYENVRIDDPLVSPGDPLTTPAIPAREIVLTYTNRASSGVRLTPLPWLAFQYELVAESRENDSFAGEARSIGNSLGVTLTPLEALSFFAGYTRRDLTQNANVRVAPLYDRSLSVQDGSEDAVTSQLRFEFPLFGQRWATGWDFSWVLVDEHLRPRLEPGGGPRTPYDLDRVDGGAFLSFLHPWVEPSVEVRRIEFGERVLSRNDYEATIVVLKLTKRLGS